MSQSLLSREQIMQAIQDLPTLPQVVSRALERIGSEELDYNELADILKQDPGISSKVLKLANSAFYGMAGQISSIKEACTILGIHTLRNILISAAALDAFPVEFESVCNRESLWQHSFTVASISKFIARNLKLDQDAAFTAGLLHDIGIFVFDFSFPEQFKEVLNQNSTHDEHDTYESEQQLLGIDHSYMGSELAKKWNFPELVIDAIANHHNSDKATDNVMIDIIQSADVITHELEENKLNGEVNIPDNVTSFEKLGINSEQLTEWMPTFIELESQSQALLRL